jgi:carboxyl-terminal processing protease
MRHSTRIAVLAGPLILASSLLGSWTGQALADRAADPYQDLALFAQVLSHVQTHYVDDVSQRELIDGAIDGMVGKLDTHTRWLDPREYQDLQDDTEGRYEGIGVEVRRAAYGVRIVRVLPGGPAARDGLQPGDRLLAVDGVSIAGAELSRVSAALRGARGTRVDLTVDRDGWDQPRVVQTMRDRIDLEAVQAGALPGGVAYVRLVSFQDGCAGELERALRAQRQAGNTQGLVLDLRDNPGGLLEEAVAIVDLFVDDGPIVSTRGRSEGEQVRIATRGGFGPDLPIAVLVNRGSASASEVVTGALQDLGRATIVGTRTYGKGTVQTVFGTQGGSALKLTIGRYYTPAGTPVASETGRTPDWVIPYPTDPTPKEALRSRLASLDLDPDLRTELLTLAAAVPDADPEDPVIPWEAPLDERMVQDPQLRAALSALAR